MSYTHFVRNKSTRLGLALVIVALACGLILLGHSPSGASHAAIPERLDAPGGRSVLAADNPPGLTSVADADRMTRLRANEGPGKLPLSFEVNQGQTDGQVESLSRGGGYKLFLAPAGATVQFSAATYSVGEGDQRVTLMVTRSGDTSSPATVDFATSDLAGSQNCNVITGIASSRCDYETGIGTLKFAAGETSKSVSVLIIDDSYLEGPETFTVSLTNLSGATLGSPATATVTINDNEIANGVNPIDTASFFVRLHYLDFLNREPDQSGLNFWTNEITSCGANQVCIETKRINVSAAFYLSIEFQQTGYLVERIYKTAYGDASGASTFNGSHQFAVPIVRLNEFLADTQEIGQGVVVGQTGWEQVLENNKQAFIAGFAQRARFTTAFPASLTPAVFVDTLNSNAGNPLSPSERNQLVTDLTTNAKTRAQVLRTIAEHQNLANAESNRAFVLMQFFGYLRRNPNDPQDTDYTGYDFWLTKLNQFNGNFQNAEMVKAFIASGEYGDRFGAAATPTPTPSSLTPEQRLAALEAVRAKFESLKNSADPNSVNQELLNFIRSRPEFAESGISDDSCVWATYTDGVELIVVNNRDPDPLYSPALTSRPAVAPSVSANPQPENLPDSIKARLLFSLGPAFHNPVPDIRTWLNVENYSQPINEGATVDALKHVGGDGVLYFEGHGGQGKKYNSDEYSSYSISTADEPTVESDKAFLDAGDLLPSTDSAKLGRVHLTYMVATYGGNFFGRFSEKKTYAITSQFIRDYWKPFSKNSFVFIGACSGASDEAKAVRNAIMEKGASVYAGWTNPVDDRIDFEASRFVFDRLLGANKVYLESEITGFNQRPFDYQSVFEDLKQHGLGHDPKSGADLVFIPFPPFVSPSNPTIPQDNGNFQLLAPSIEFMSVDEVNGPTLYIYGGEFGEDPGKNSRAVFVGGQEIQVRTWDPSVILCDLPKSWPSGEVIVTVRQQKSNTAYLTEWEGDFTHTVKGLGTLKQTVTYHVRFRADIRKVRNHIHEQPTITSGRSFWSTGDSTSAYESSGTYTFPNGCTEKWSGSGLLSANLFLTTGGDGFSLVGVAFDDSRLPLAFFVNGPRIVTVSCPGPPPTTTTNNEGLFDPDAFGNLIDVDFDGNFNIKANTLTGTDNGGNKHTLTWNEIKPKNGTAPKPDSPR